MYSIDYPSSSTFNFSSSGSFPIDQGDRSTKLILKICQMCFLVTTNLPTDQLFDVFIHYSSRLQIEVAVPSVCQ